MLLTGGGNLAVSVAGVGVLLVFAFAFSGYGKDFKRRVGLLATAVVVLVGCVFIRDYVFDMRVTVLHTTGQYTVVRYRADVVIAGTGRGGEAALLRYLDKRGVRRADLMMFNPTQPPRPADIERIKLLLPRVRMIYFPSLYNPPESLIEAALANNVQMITTHREWDNRLFIYAESIEMGRLRLGDVMGATWLTFGDTVINFGGDEISSTITIAGAQIRIGETEYNMEEHGAQSLRTNGQTIRYWWMR